MNYLNLHTDTLRSESYLGADPIERATWLNLMAWCASQENGGVIKGASEWGDRKWLQLCGITKEEATLVSRLYHVNDDGDLIVNLYPLEKETEVRTKRDIAKTNGAKGGRPKGKPNQNPEETNIGFNTETDEEPTLKSVKEGKGREGKGMEWKEGEAREAQAHPPESIESIIEKINKLKPSWQKSPHMTQPEMYDLHQNQMGLMTMDDLTWETLRAWSQSHEGQEDWTMKTRSRFLANYSEAAMKACEWITKGGTVNPAHLSLGGRKAHSTTIV